MNDWISVKDRLPEESGKYLVWVQWPCEEFPSHGIVHYDADVGAFGVWREEFDRFTLGRLGSDFWEVDVLYWMPLPDAPEEEQ